MFSPTKLKEKRESQGLSQSQLASSLGISRASYFNWESGKTKPNQNNLRKLSQILNVDPRYFESEYEIVETYLKLTERNQEATLNYATELLNKQNAKVVDLPQRLPIRSTKNYQLVRERLTLMMVITIQFISITNLIMTLHHGCLVIQWNRHMKMVQLPLLSKQDLIMTELFMR